jgi:ABC-type sugar transport system substrate-binding protein
VKRYLVIVAAVLMAALVLGGCKGKEQGQGGENKFRYRVGFSNINASDENCHVSEAIFVERLKSEEFKKMVGREVEVILGDSALNAERQANNVETMLTRGIDLLILIGVDTEANTTVVEMCNKEGVPVWMFATEASGGDYKFIGFDEAELGRKQGEWCVENLKQNAKIFYLQGTPGREAAILRESGFREGIKSRPDLVIASAQNGNFERARAMQITEDWIQAYGESIDCIVSCNNMMIPGVIDALKAAGMNDNVVTGGVIHLGTWDRDPIRDGSQNFAVYVGFETLGEISAEVVEKFYLGEPIGERTLIPLSNATRENYRDYF